MARRRMRLTPNTRYSAGPKTGRNQMMPIQSVAARESRLLSRAWQEASTTASRSKPATRCGQNWEILSSQSIGEYVQRKRGGAQVWRQRSNPDLALNHNLFQPG